MELVKKEIAKAKPKASKALKFVKKPASKTLLKNPVAKAKKNTKSMTITKAGEYLVTKSEESKKKLKTNSKTKLKKSDVDSVGFISGTPSLRLLERVKVYESWYNSHSVQIIRPTAQVFGYMFIVAGILSMYFNLVNSRDAFQGSSLLAFLPCAESNCLSTTTPITTAPVLLAPQVTFLTTPIVTPKTNTPITVQITNVSEYYMILFSPKTGKIVRVSNPSVDQENKYLYNLPTSELDPGEYIVQVKVSMLNGESKSVFNGPTIVVPPQEVIAPNHTSSSTNLTDDTNTVATTTSPSVPPVTSSTTTEPIKVIQDKLATTTEKIIVPVASSTKEALPILIKEPEPTIEQPIVLKLVPTETLTQQRLHIKTTFVYERVEVYAQLENSSSELFLGVASKSSSEYYYWLDTANLPVGSYRIIVKGIINNSTKDVANLKFINKSTSLKPQVKPAEERSATGTVDLVNQRLKMVTDFKSISNLNQQGTGTASTTKVTEAIPSVAKDLISKHGQDFNKLFANYASALSAGKEEMIRLAEEELAKGAKRVTEKSSLDNDTQLSYAELSAGMDEEIAKIKTQVKYVDTLLQERTADNSKKDTDLDGISDIDEEMIYKTNPNNADTDGDGFSDGIEITTGYNPLDPSPEAIISFSSPKDFSYVNDEVLSVAAITPMLNYEPDQSKPNVYSEISGKGVPNSFVTLYVFSTPTVVTVKTDTEGNFSYIFSKELEDGEHEVYVAMTDNTGSIVVRSNPLKFIKTAEAYNYVDAASSEPIPTVPVSEASEFKLLNLVASMGVVSFGLILILLGKSVLARKEDIVVSV